MQQFKLLNSGLADVSGQALTDACLPARMSTRMSTRMAGRLVRRFSLRCSVSLVLFLGLGWQSCYAVDELLIGQVATLSGPNGAELGNGMALGQRVYLDHINSQGGVFGRKIRLVSLDDRYNPAETLRLTTQLLRDLDPIALIGYRGTATTLALVKSGILVKEGIPLIGTLTGARELQGAANVYSTRASYQIEAHQLVTQVVQQGSREISVLYVNDPFGKSGLQAAQDAIKAEHGKLAYTAAYDEAPEKVDDSIKKAVDTLCVPRPGAIIMIAVGAPALKFMQMCREQAPHMPLFSLSVIDANAVVKLLGPAKAMGIVISQVFPYLYSDVNPLAREDRAMLKAYEPSAVPDYFGLEGFVNAKILVAALRNAGATPTRASLIQALDSLGEIDLGDFWLQFTPSHHNGSQFVDLTVISRSGQLIQ